jgi:hypothetical protein
MEAAGDGFITSSLPNSSKKVCNPCKIKCGVDRCVFFIPASLTYQNGDENP